MIDADKPIQSSEQDRLGRTAFAKYLARCILDQKNQQNFVIGLSGYAGSGKTSIINLMLEEMRYASSNMFDDEKPIMLNFSPWSYSGQQPLIYHFFRRLSATLREFPYLENKEKIIDLLELYISYFTQRTVPVALTSKKKFWRRLLKTKDKMAWESGRDLTHVKAELNALLSQQKHRIVICIDNVGRLEDMEVKQIFQIVKSMGDFANTVYLLSYDKTRLLQAIQAFHGGGNSYLEKVVQLPFEVPEISTQMLENILFDRLKPIIAIAVEDTWNVNYWTDLYYSYLKKLFVTCRDITKYVNTLGFSFLHVKDVVNPVDFFALTSLEVFEPKVYAAIRDNKDLFTDLVDSVYAIDKENIENDKLRLDEIMQRAEKLTPDVLRNMLIEMFPRLRRVYQPSIPFYHSEMVARKNFRICCPDIFDVYFRLSLPLGYIPLSEVHAILRLAKDKDVFTESLLRLNQEDRAANFLNLFDHEALLAIPKAVIPNIIGSLIDVLDLLPNGQNNNVSCDTQTRANRIIHQLLRRFNTTEERFKLLEQAFQQAIKSLYSIVHEIIEQQREHIETEDTYVPEQHRDLTTKQLASLKLIAVEKIAYWAKIGRLAEHPRLVSILYAWKDWGSVDASRAFVAEMVKTDRGIIAFLQAFLQIPIDEVSGQLERQQGWEIYLANIQDFITLDKLEKHAKMLFEDMYFDKLREREQLALMIFLDLTKTDTLKVMPKL